MTGSPLDAVCWREDAFETMSVPDSDPGTERYYDLFSASGVEAIDEGGVPVWNPAVVDALGRDRRDLDSERMKVLIANRLEILPRFRDPEFIN